MRALPRRRDSVLDQYEYSKQENLLDQEDKAAQLECKGYDRLDSGRPKKIVKLVAADVADGEPSESTIRLHSTKRTLT